MTVTAYGFVDAGYLRQIAIEQALGSYANPQLLVRRVVGSESIERWAGGTRINPIIRAARTRVYDAEHETAAKRDQTRAAYLDAVELLPDTHLGYGFVRGEGKKLRQKGVDTLIAVDMLVGAFTKLFDIAVLVAADADFVPVVAEVQRRGVMVVVAAQEGSRLSNELRRTSDRFVRILPGPEMAGAPDDAVFLPAMKAFPLPGPGAP